MLKPAVRKILKPLLDRMPGCQAQPYGRMAPRDRFMDIKMKVGHESPFIVDGGANNGSTVALFLSQYESPLVHAFEPVPELVSGLLSRFSNNPNVNIHGVALGAETGKVCFNVASDLATSSVLSPSSILKGYHGEKVAAKRVIEAPQVRLDDTLWGGAHEVDILKLDLQGYEFEALKGCGKLLTKIRLITTEVEFVPLYEGQPLFGDIDIFLRNEGFILLNLYELYTHPDGQLTSGDAVYLNSRYF
jgi:FkbM family methyltransferase